MSTPILKGRPRAPSLTDGEKRFIDAACEHDTIWQMAVAMGRSYQIVKGYLQKSGQVARQRNKRKWTDADRRWLAKHRHLGWVWCAKQLGLSVVSVRSQGARWGLEKPFNRVQDDDRLLAMYECGMTTGQMGREFGVDAETIRCHLIRIGKAMPGRNKAWRDSPKRRAKASTLLTQKKRLHKRRAAELGWPHFKYNESLVLAALEKLRVGDRDAVAEEVGRCCTAHRWRVSLQRPLSALGVLCSLTARGFVIDYGKGKERRRYRLRRNLKSMSRRQLNALAERSKSVRKELAELTRMKCNLAKEACRVGSRKIAG